MRAHRWIVLAATGHLEEVMIYRGPIKAVLEPVEPSGIGMRCRAMERELVHCSARCVGVA